jgi:hypothetical protein
VRDVAARGMWSSRAIERACSGAELAQCARRAGDGRGDRHRWHEGARQTSRDANLDSERIVREILANEQASMRPSVRRAATSCRRSWPTRRDDQLVARGPAEAGRAAQPEGRPIERCTAGAAQGRQTPPRPATVERVPGQRGGRGLPSTPTSGRSCSPPMREPGRRSSELLSQIPERRRRRRRLRSPGIGTPIRDLTRQPVPTPATAAPPSRSASKEQTPVGPRLPVGGNAPARPRPRAG